MTITTDDLDLELINYFFTIQEKINAHEKVKMEREAKKNKLKGRSRGRH